MDIQSSSSVDGYVYAASKILEKPSFTDFCAGA